jgi:hypothetical protein
MLRPVRRRTNCGHEHALVSLRTFCTAGVSPALFRNYSYAVRYPPTQASVLFVALPRGRVNSIGTYRVWYYPPCHKTKRHGDSKRRLRLLQTRRANLRILTLTTIVLFCTVSSPAQHRHTKSNPGSVCGDESKALPDFYYDAVLESIKPPDWQKALISLAEGGERKLVLWTDGEKFKLWTDTPDKKSIDGFLLDLDQACRLPADPKDAVALIKFKWESKELSSEQFAQLHREFTNALPRYVSNAQERYDSLVKTRMHTVWLDAIRYPIVYDNHDEHVEIEAYYVLEDPVVKWVLNLKKLGEDSFDRSFGSQP